MKKVGYGIIGTGMIAAFHAQALAQIPEAQLVAVCDAIPDRAKSFAEKYGCRALSMEEMQSAPDVDAVTIATPSGTHAQVAVPCALHGKHVLCEKPLDVTVEAAESMIEACRKAGVLLGAIYPARYHSCTQFVKKQLDAGRLGAPVLCSGSLRWFRTREYYSGWHGTSKLDGGGARMNQGIHTADLMLYLNGDVAQVYARSGRRLYDHIEVEDTITAVLQYKNGSFGTLECSTACAPGYPKFVSLSGTQGSMIIEEDRLTRFTFTEKQPGDDEAVAQFQGEGHGDGAGRPDDMSYECHRRQMVEFTAAIQGRGPLVTDGHEGLRAIRLIRAIYQSAATGKPVDL